MQQLRLFILLLLLCASQAVAQNSLGLSINYGDNLKFSPEFSSKLLNRKSLAPTLVFTNQQNFHSDFAALFSFEAGITGYHLVPVIDRERYPFVDYGILVTKAEVVPGKIFKVKGQNIFVGLGGGVSYHFLFSPFTTMDVFAYNNGSSGGVFSALIEGSNNGTLTTFAKLRFRLQLSERYDIGFQYYRHFQSILTGQFEFYEASATSSGSIKLYPQGFSVIISCRLKSSKHDE
jgi:hypothetical protein